MMLIWQLTHTHQYVFFIFFGLITLMIGSFINVLIYRLPIMLKQQWQSDCHVLLNLPEKPASQVFNLWLPRSFCPSCNHTLSFYCNIPVLSWLILKRRCLYCQASISILYPAIEIMCCLLSLLAAWHFGIDFLLIFISLFIWINIALFFIDLEHFLLPDNLTLTLLWLGLIANYYTLFTTLPEAMFSACGAYLVLWSIMQIFYLVTGKIGMGHGDFKLFAAYGAWFGWTKLPLILLVASLSGATFGAIYLFFTRKGKNTPIPFGPFLCCSGLICLFTSQSSLISIFY